MSDGGELKKGSSYFLNIAGGWCCGWRRMCSHTVTLSFSFVKISFTAEQRHTLHSYRNSSLWQLWVSTATAGHTEINRDWVTSCLAPSFLFWNYEPATRCTPGARREKRLLLHSSGWRILILVPAITTWINTANLPGFVKLNLPMFKWEKNVKKCPKPKNTHLVFSFMCKIPSHYSTLGRAQTRPDLTN